MDTKEDQPALARQKNPRFPSNPALRSSPVITREATRRRLEQQGQQERKELGRLGFPPVSIPPGISTSTRITQAPNPSQMPSRPPLQARPKSSTIPINPTLPSSIPLIPPVTPPAPPRLNPLNLLNPINPTTSEEFKSTGLLGPSSPVFSSLQPPGFNQSQLSAPGISSGFSSVTNFGMGTNAPGMNSSQPNPSYYFDSQYLPPIMNQFTDLVHDNRRKGRSQAHIDRGLLQDLDQARRELQQCQAQAPQVAVQAAQPILNTILDPLYRYYQTTQPNNPAAYPNYAYFMGLSQIMLDAIAEMARLLSQTCALAARVPPNIPNSTNRNVDWRELLLNFQECKGDQAADLRAMILRHPTIDLMQADLKAYIGRLVRSDPAYQDRIFNGLTLQNEAEEEKKAFNEIKLDLEAAEQARDSLRERGYANFTYIDDSIQSIQQDLNDSQLRLSIIAKIQQQLPTILRAFFNHEAYPQPFL